MAKQSAELVSNRKARHLYEILETFEAGIALKGTEVKSLRDNGGHLQEAYCRVLDNELWLIGASIAPYRHGNIHNHLEKRNRKLLMHKKEIKEIKEAIAEKGHTIVPLSMYLRQGKVKVKIALARGKKLFDKRQTIKERDQKRQMDRAIRQARSSD